MAKFYTYSVLGPLCQIEFPATKGGREKPEPLKRTSEGSLHLRPGSTVELTDDERSYIEERHPVVAVQLRLAAETKDKPTSEVAPETPPGGNDSGSGGSGGSSGSAPTKGGKGGKSSSSSDE